MLLAYSFTRRKHAWENDSFHVIFPNKIIFHLNYPAQPVDYKVTIITNPLSCHQASPAWTSQKKERKKTRGGTSPAVFQIARQRRWQPGVMRRAIISVISWSSSRLRCSDYIHHIRGNFSSVSLSLPCVRTYLCRYAHVHTAAPFSLVAGMKICYSARTVQVICIDLILMDGRVSY